MANYSTSYAIPQQGDLFAIFKDNTVLQVQVDIVVLKEQLYPLNYRKLMAFKNIDNEFFPR